MIFDIFMILVNPSGLGDFVLVTKTRKMLKILFFLKTLGNVRFRPGETPLTIRDGLPMVVGPANLMKFPKIMNAKMSMLYMSKLYSPFCA